MLPLINHSKTVLKSYQECIFCNRKNDVEYSKTIYHCLYCRRTNYVFSKSPQITKKPQATIELPNLEVSYLCLTCNHKNKSYSVRQPAECYECSSQLLVRDGYKMQQYTPKAPIEYPQEEVNFSQMFPPDIFQLGYHPFYVYDNGYINKYLNVYNKVEHSIEKVKDQELKKFRNRREMERIKRELYAMHLKKDIYKPVFDTVHSIDYKVLRSSNQRRRFDP